MSDRSNLFRSYYPEKDNVNETPFFMGSYLEQKVVLGSKVLRSVARGKMEREFQCP